MNKPTQHNEPNLKIAFLLCVAVIFFVFASVSFLVGWRDGADYSYSETCSTPQNPFESYAFTYRIGRIIGCTLHKNYE